MGGVIPAYAPAGRASYGCRATRGQVWGGRVAGTTTFEIHPAIGIARVGNSPQFFVGPEPGGAPPASYRDAAGGLLRQAARFRIFRCSRAEDGSLLSAKEVNEPDVHIEW